MLNHADPVTLTFDLHVVSLVEISSAVSSVKCELTDVRNFISCRTFKVKVVVKVTTHALGKQT